MISLFRFQHNYERIEEKRNPLNQNLALRRSRIRYRFDFENHHLPRAGFHVLFLELSCRKNIFALRATFHGFLQNDKPIETILNQMNTRKVSPLKRAAFPSTLRLSVSLLHSYSNRAPETCAGCRRNDSGNRDRSKRNPPYNANFQKLLVSQKKKNQENHILISDALMFVEVLRGSAACQTNTALEILGVFVAKLVLLKLSIGLE